MLAGKLPPPFRIKEEKADFYNLDLSRQLVAGGQVTIQKLLEYLSDKPDPSFVLPAVLLLAYFDPALYYPQLLQILQKAELPVIESFEHGFWQISLPEEQLANDLFRSVPANPSLLLLLQRPVAKNFKAALQEMIESKMNPLSLFAMYCFEYTLENGDDPFLEKVSAWQGIPEIAALAKNYMDKIKPGPAENRSGSPN